MAGRRLGVEHLAVAVLLSHLGKVLRQAGRVLVDLGDPNLGIECLRRALAIDQEFHGHRHPLVAAGLRDLSRALQRSGALGEARLACHRALAIDSAVYGRNHLAVASDLRRLGDILWDMGDSYAAEYCFERARHIEPRSDH